jgi:hypothetical protein
MGNYINKLPNGEPLGHMDKSDRIAALEGVLEIPRPPKKIKDVPLGKIVVTVVLNLPWEAALICDTQHDLDVVQPRQRDHRPVRFFLIDADLVRAMADGELYSEIGRKKNA